MPGTHVRHNRRHARRTETVRAIFGADPFDSGEVYVQGQKVQIKSPGDAVKHGIGYLSEDRKRYGLALGMDVETNMVLAAFEKFLGALGWVNQTKTRETAAYYVDALKEKTPTLQQRVNNISGGNQQKVIIGKWLTADTYILIFDEPTRGIDVGAKVEMYHLINQLSLEGKAVILISSDMPELISLSDRIYVMRQGRFVAELESSKTSQEEILAFASGFKEAQAAQGRETLFFRPQPAAYKF